MAETSSPNRTERPVAADPASSDQRAVLERLVAIDERLGRLEVAVGRLAPEPAISRADRGVCEALLPALALAFPRTDFTTAELLAHQSVALRRVLAGRSAKSVGRLLRRSRGVVVGGWSVDAIGMENGAKVWRISSVLLRLSEGVKPA